MKLSELIDDKYKANKPVEKKNKKLNEGLIGLILAPLAIYYVSQWLANLLENIADYLDGNNTKLIKAQKQIIANVQGSAIQKKFNAAFNSGASASKLADIYVKDPETQRELKKWAKDKNVIEAGGLEALEAELRKTMIKAANDSRLENQTVSDLEKKLK